MNLIRYSSCSLVIDSWPGIDDFQLLQKDRDRNAIRGGYSVQNKWLWGSGHGGGVNEVVSKKVFTVYIENYNYDESAPVMLMKLIV